MLEKIYHNGCVYHIVDGDDLEWFPRTHNPGSLRQLLYRCTCCTCCTGTLGTPGTPTVQHTRLGQQLLYAVPAVPLYLLYHGTAGTADRRGSAPGPFGRRTCTVCTESRAMTMTRSLSPCFPTKVRGLLRDSSVFSIAPSLFVCAASLAACSSAAARVCWQPWGSAGPGEVMPSVCTEDACELVLVGYRAFSIPIPVGVIVLSALAPCNAPG